MVGPVVVTTGWQLLGWAVILARKYLLQRWMQVCVVLPCCFLTGSVDEQQHKRKRVDAAALHTFLYNNHLVWYREVGQLRFLGLSEGTYGTNLRSVRTDPDGSLVGLKEPFSLIIKPVLNEAGMGANCLWICRS